MIEIDGSMGEGGGQVLRSSLTLSVMTGQKMRIVNIRSTRNKPGLGHQHLKSVQAAAEICGGVVEGGKKGSQEISFTPGEVQAGNYHFDIGTAGSTSLVLQTVLLPLTKAKVPSVVTITGGDSCSLESLFPLSGFKLFTIPVENRLGCAPADGASWF